MRLGSRQHPVAASSASRGQTPPDESATRCLFSTAVAHTPRGVTVIESVSVARIDGIPAAAPVDASAAANASASATRWRNPRVMAPARRAVGCADEDSGGAAHQSVLL